MLPLFLSSIGCGSNGNHASSDAGADALADAGEADTAAPDAMAAEGGDAGGDAVGDAGGDAATDGAAGGPITGLQADTWTWVPFGDAFCRDGSTTGIGVNMHSGSDKLMIFLQGGGACFNVATCLQNPPSFGAADFAALTATGMDAGGAATGGVFDRSDAANPVKDWSFVFVPYCTGDVHAGNKPDGSVNGAGSQRFVGYANIAAYLRRVVPTFPGVSQVLLAGASAGGFGATANYIQVANAFGSIPVALLDDSGPFMDSPTIPTCLSQLWVQTWGLDKTLLADCGNFCANDGHFLVQYAKRVLVTYPTVPVGLIDSTDDSVITRFFGFGNSNCTAFQQLDATTFTAGLEDIRTQLASEPNFGSYVFDGTRHTTIQSTADLDMQSIPAPDGGGVALTDWIAQLVAGHASDVGP